MSNFKAKQGQDKWVLSVLKNKKNGFFVEIGAHNGVDDSNAYALEKDFGWQGICVEPHTYSFKLAEENRSCICENFCISGMNGTVKFVQRGRKRQLSGIYDDFADDEIIQKVEAGHSVIEKESITLLALLEKHKCNNIIDYLSIDTEGAEFGILQHFPFDRYKFLTVSVEHNANRGKQNATKRIKIFELLSSNGYQRSEYQEYEDWYVYCPNANSKIVSYADLETLGNYHRSIGSEIVSTNGCFDILHRGHIKFLEECKLFGDTLIVGLNSDESVRSIKGNNRPIMDESSRVSVISHIDLVDHICVFEEPTPSKMLLELKPDVHCKGADYKNDTKEMPEKIIVESNGGRIEIIPLDPGYGTTNIVNKITND